MDFLSCQNETLSFRVYLSSNETSTTLYIEELPNYSSDKEKLSVLSVYFYFHGNECFDVLKLYNQICNQTCDFEEIKEFVLNRLSKIKNDKFSFTNKEVSKFSVKPSYKTQIKLSGIDFFGVSAWQFFFLVSKNRELCMCIDKESARRFFKSLIKNKTDLRNISYKNLINILINNKININMSN